MSAQHELAVGEAERFLPDLGQGSPGSGSFNIVRLLPGTARVLQYWLKLDGHERVVREDQITRL